MSFRVGTDGAEMWPRCKAMGIAAITYKSLAETDLSKYPLGEPKARWDLLESSQKFSLKRLTAENVAQLEAVFRKPCNSA